MERAIVYLRTPLFGIAGPEAHVPAGAVVIEGTIAERPSGALTVQTERLRDDRGRELAEVALKLEIPWSKVDHIHWVG